MFVAPPAVTLQLLFTSRNYMNETKGVFMYRGGGNTISVKPLGVMIHIAGK
jgi:hypothetical protein